MLEQAEVSTAAAAKTKLTTEIADSIQALAGGSGPKTVAASAPAVNIGQLVALRPK
jgi:hypothetical protein